MAAMARRTIALFVAAAAVLLLVQAAASAQAQPRQRPPNIVFIMADDLGYRELGSFGQERIRTPNLDRLAAEGMRLTRHYSGSAVCAPTRAVLMTGRHTGHSPIRGNRERGGWGPEEPEGQHPLPAEEVTIAELLGRAGYATGGFGKWGLGGPGTEGHPNFQGFDHFYGYLCQRVAHNYYPTHLWRNHDVDVLHGNRYFAAHQRIEAPLASEEEYDKRFAGEDYAPEHIAGEMLGWVRRHHERSPERPFFLYYPTVIPHLALQAPRDFVDMYPRSWDEVHYLGDRGYLPSPRPRATYAAMITHLDDSVGRLLGLLEELGLAEDTIVVFTSDNGTSYVGGVDREFFDSLGELRGRKGTLWEGGIRVPTIVRWPGRIAPGSQSDLPGYHPDWLPTLAEAAGMEPPEGLDGESLLGELTGSGSGPGERALYWEFPEGPQQQAVIFGAGGRWKAIRPALRDDPDRLELYDLHGDPAERHDLAAAEPALVARALEMMQNRVASRLFPIPAIDSDAP